MTGVEGEVNDSNEINKDEVSEDKLSDAFKTLLMDINDIKERLLSLWFTLIENLLVKLVIMINIVNTHVKGLVNDLNSLSFMH